MIIVEAVDGDDLERTDAARQELERFQLGGWPIDAVAVKKDPRVDRDGWITSGTLVVRQFPLVGLIE